MIQGCVECGRAHAMIHIAKVRADNAERRERVLSERLEEARAEAKMYKNECASISKEFGLPSSIRPAEGEIKRMLDGWKQSRQEVEELRKRLGDISEVSGAQLAESFTKGTLAAGDAMREQVEKAFSRGVAAMREAAMQWARCAFVFGAMASVVERDLRALPDPEDKP